MKWKFETLIPITGPITGVIAVAMTVMLVSVEADSPASTQIESEIEAEGEEAPDIPTLIKTLGDDSYIARQAATMSLWNMGSDTLPALRQAASGSP